MAEEQLSLDPLPTPQEPLLSLDYGARNEVPLPFDIAAARAYKALQSIKDKSYEQVLEEIKSGNEDRLRREIAARLDIERDGQLTEAIRKVALSKGGPLSTEEASFVTAKVKEAQQPTNPNTVIEEEYAKKYTSALDSVSFMRETFLPELKQDVPELVRQQTLEGTSYVAKQEILLRELENRSAVYNKQGYFSWGLDMAKQLLPGFVHYKMSGNVPGPGTTFFSGLRGEILDNQALALWKIPVPEFEQRVKAVAEYLGKDNPNLAVEWLSAMLSLSGEDRIKNNAFTVLDVLSIPGITAAKMALRTKDAIKFNKAIKDVIKSNSSPEQSTINAVEAAGDIEKAAVTKAAEGVIKEIKGTYNPVKDAQESMVHTFQGAIDEVKGNPGNYSQELVNRIVESYSSLRYNLGNLLRDTARIERLPAVLRVEAAMDAVKEAARRDYPGLENTIINISTPYSVPEGYMVDVHIGKPGPKLFGNLRDAETFANTHGLKGYIIGDETQKGLGYTIKISKPLKEDQNIIKDYLAYTKETSKPKNLVNLFGDFLGTYRSPEDVLSAENMMMRKIATYAPSNFFKLLKEDAVEINKLGKWSIPLSTKRQKWHQWNQVVEASMHARNPDTGDVGHLFRGPGEFAEFFYNKTQRLPDEQEVAAYFSYKRAILAQQVFENSHKYVNKHRAGGQTHTIYALDTSRETSKIIPYVTKTFDGVKMTESWPTRGDTMLIVGDKLTESRLVRSDRYKGKKQQEWEKRIKEGSAVLLRILDPSERPLQGFGPVTDQRVRYVIVNKVDSAPLSWNQTKPRKPVTDYDWYISQANIKFDRVTLSNWYEGDTTIAAHNIRKIAHDVAERLDNIRVLLRDNKIDEARALSFHVDFDEVLGWFTSGRLNYNQPIKAVPRGKTVADVDTSVRNMEGFKDGSRERFGRSFNEPVDPYDIFTVDDVGTKGNPLYQVTPVRYLDPITTISRGLTKAVHTMFMDDYKVFSIERWIQEAKEYIRTTPGSSVDDAPFYYFYNHDFISAMDPNKAKVLETANFQIKQFIGVQSPTETFAHLTAQHLADSIYTKLGPGKAMLYPGHMLPKLRDPFGFLRSAVFHPTIGLFNIPQLVVQLQTFSAIFGIAGLRSATSGTTAALLHGWSRFNRSPEIMAKLDDLAVKFGWRPGELEESIRLMESTGFQNVAGEHILRDLTNFNLVQSGKQTLLDWGTKPFIWGEKGVRYGAWHTAYKEFRDKNPTGRITEVERAEILNRADLLSINMSRASASSWNKGILSIPAQFLTYQLRLTELFLGKGRLTPMERTRLFGTMAILYGFPATSGLVGLPIGDYIHRKMRDSAGYVVGDNALSTALMEGIPSLLIGLSTGQHYNISERYSTPGFDFMKETLRSDRTFWDIVGGAAYSKGKGIFEASDPFLKAMMSLIRDDNQAFPIGLDDVVGLFKEISSVNNTWRLMMAINTGKWLSKKEQLLDTVSTPNAIFSYLTGLSPQNIQEMANRSWTRQVEKDIQNHGRDQFIKEYRRALNVKDNPEQVRFYLKRANAILAITGYPEEQRHRLISLALEGNETLVDRIKWEYFFGESVPMHRRGTALDALQRTLELEKGNK